MTTAVHKIVLLFFFWFVGATAYSQTLEKVYDRLAAEIFEPNQPGGVVLISKKGVVTYKKAFGLANMELAVPMKTNMIFEIGSLTKQFTAVAILQLLEQGKLQLADPITKYLPDYPIDGNTITIQHLLTHTAGVKNYTNMEKWLTTWRQDLSLTETIALFRDEPLEFKPSEKFSYSNSGYVLLGYIIEKVTGISYSNYIDEHILKPIGMRNTQFGSHKKIIKNRVCGYQMSTDLVNAEYLSFSQPHAAGALMSTVDDFLIWHKALRSNSLIKKETLQLAETNYQTTDGVAINYGYGWLLNELYGSPTIEHGGGIFGFTSYQMYLPKEDIYVVVFTNCDKYNPESLAVKLAAASMPVKTITTKKKTIAPELAAKYVGNYLFDDKMIRSIIFENNTLYSQIAGGDKMALVPITDHVFDFLGIVDSHLRFEFMNDSITAFLQNRIQVKKGHKIATTNPTPNELQLSLQQLQPYVGEYSIASNINFKVNIEQQHLVLLFTRQPKIEIFARSESQFFAKIAPVEIEFKKDENQIITSAVISQNGQHFTARKIL